MDSREKLLCNVKEGDISLDDDIAVGDVMKECTRQGSKYAFWATLAAKAKTQVDKLKLSKTTIEAQLDKKIRKKAADTHTKITESAITNKIHLDEEWTKVNLEIIDWQEKYGVLCGARDSLSQRKDLLVVLGNNEIQEKRSNVRVMDKE